MNHTMQTAVIFQSELREATPFESSHTEYNGLRITLEKKLKPIPLSFWTSGENEDAIRFLWGPPDIEVVADVTVDRHL